MCMHIVLIPWCWISPAWCWPKRCCLTWAWALIQSMNSWGNMINAARLEMAREPLVWWPLVAAFVFMFALVLAANLFADAVRDAFDPRTVFASRETVPEGQES